MSKNRFTAMTSNIVESVNAVIKPFTGCPIDYLFESLKHMLQGWFCKNQSLACATFTRLAGKQENLLRLNAKCSTGLKVTFLILHLKIL